MLPVAAAIGGVGGSAAVYYIYVSANYQEILRGGVSAATAVDLAVAYFVIRTIFHRHAVVPFLLVLALATNVLGFLMVASEYTWVDVRPGGAAFMAAALVLAFILRRLRLRSFWPYLFGAGTLSWWALYVMACTRPWPFCRLCRSCRMGRAGETCWRTCRTAIVIRRAASSTSGMTPFRACCFSLLSSTRVSWQQRLDYTCQRASTGGTWSWPHVRRR
jgi:hypothetical protein